MAAMQLTRTHRILIGVVVSGAVIIAGIGFAGSYAAVRDLAERKGFGDFAAVFPIGIDAGICVLLALDLLLTWMRIPFPMLRQTAWLLTIATIAFNGAASWPDPLGVGMHSVIPVLFVVSVEAARHAVGRIADITADKHMEGVRLTRWLLSPIPTFKLWRRMKLWELRSYEQVIKLEQDRLVYQARLQARYGRAWRRKAPVESLMPLRLARYGVPLAETAAAGLAAAGVEPLLLPPAPQRQPAHEPLPAPKQAQELRELPAKPAEESRHAPAREVPEEFWPEDEWPQEHMEHPYPADHGGYDGHPGYDGHDGYEARAGHPQQNQQNQRDQRDQQGNPWFAAQAPQGGYEGGYDPEYPGYPGYSDYTESPEHAPVQVPTGSGGTRPLGDPRPRPEGPAPEPGESPESAESTESAEQLAQAEEEFYDAAYPVFVSVSNDLGDYPKVEQLDIHLSDAGITHPRSLALLRQVHSAFKDRFQAEMVDEHIA
ncbi:DUF2637 domain-containing protein [Streptomyces katsurahamanus]|uniref:DUF2637 domain-containing protein n=1 Tax=Streptomyces katsurahamanus TaxID=2577098 RepID=A0ABW9NP16_9ACTN|nr:DUF2637 domain-containing protein [Streptomyces katsurahamanus]MQS35052.1 DUF2637 domain-containing protein [Streptomyces katsurahamanus]